MMEKNRNMESRAGELFLSHTNVMMKISNHVSFQVEATKKLVRVRERGKKKRDRERETDRIMKTENTFCSEGCVE